jgi:hypothetical protein
MVWMAAPSSFNDPFDCQPEIVRNPESEGRMQAMIVQNYCPKIEKALRESKTMLGRQREPIRRRTLLQLRKYLGLPHLPDDKKYNELKKWFAVPPDGDAAFSALKARLCQVGVLSLSATPKEMLMWAHYASQHSGFCLGFECSVGSLLKNDAHTKAVKYLDTYPEIHLNTLPINWKVSVEIGGISDSMVVDIQEPRLQAAIYSKSKDWEYEQEWRVLASEVGKQPYPGPLKKIIFGMRCEQDSRLRIARAAVNAAECPIQFAEIKQQTPRSFALEVVKLDLGISST